MVLAEQSQGYADYIRAAKEYLFGDAHVAIVGEDNSLLNALLLFVRYPRRMKWVNAERHAMDLEQVSHVLTPFPSDPYRVFEAVEKIYEILVNSENYLTGTQPSKGLGNFLAKLSHHPGESNLLYPLRQRYRPRSISRGASLVRPNSRHGKSGRITWTNAPENRAQYLLDRVAVMPHVKKLRRWFESQQEPFASAANNSMSGSLDPRLLHRAPLNDLRLFKRHTNPKVRRYAVGLLMDESGSMRGTKSEAARKVAVLFHQALSAADNIELFIYGHTADLVD